MIATVVRNPNGKARHEVSLGSVTIPDIRHLAVGHPNVRHRREMLSYFRDVTALLFAARIDADYPPRFFVPDLWFAGVSFAREASDQVLEAWHLGHDLAEALGYVRDDACHDGAMFVRRESVQ